MKKGFTLVELLAVIVILAIILAIAVPGISKVINSSTTASFESDAKMVLTALRYKTMADDTFNSTSTTIANLSDLNLSSQNYESLNAGIVNKEIYIVITGKNKWDGLTACGTSKSMKIMKSNETLNCEIPFDYNGNYQTLVVPSTGNYKIELWGAQGGSIDGGKGGYTNGQIQLTAGETIYFYVGSTTLTGTGGYNGGGNVTGNVYGGGGATDVRLVSGNWNDVTSLRSRIMVAAGGGGYGIYDNCIGGAAGGLNGANGVGYDLGMGATQTAGGASGINGRGAGSFGKGGDGSWCNEPLGGGGAGYYGGSSAGGSDNNGSGGGGSSFISGYTGCNAIDASGVHTGQPNHYSGKIFNNTSMIAGDATMTSPSGATEVGHTGNGYAKITYLGL